MKFYNVNNKNYGGCGQPVKNLAQKARVFFKRSVNTAFSKNDKKIHPNTQPENSCFLKKIIDREVKWLKKIKLYLNYAGCWLVLKAHLYDNDALKQDAQKQMKDIKREISNINSNKSIKEGLGTIRNGVKQLWAGMKNSVVN